MARKAIGWSVPPQKDVFGRVISGGYSTRDPAAAFLPGAIPIYPGVGRGRAPIDDTVAREEALRKQARIKAELEAKRLAEEKAKRERQEAIARADSEARRKAEAKVRDIQEERGRLEKTSIQIQQIRKQLREKRGPITPIRFAKEIISPPPEKQILLGATVVGTVLENIIAWKDLPKTAKAIVQNPEILASIPSAVEKGVIDFGKLVKVSPEEAFVKIGTEVILLKGTGKAFSAVGKLTGKASAVVSPKFVGKAKIGKTLRITTQTGKKVNLKVVGRMGTKGLARETLKKQISRAGKRVTGVSAQADELVGFIKRKRLIRKPIAGEAKFTRATRKLLNKFDDGKITKKEIVKLDGIIKKQSGQGLLERSFFADPKARIRPSRLGIEKEASIIDVMKGNIKFRKPKPQILLFEKAQIEKIPKNLKKIANKLKRGKPLTKTEGDKFLSWQLEKSGKFKPLGFVSREAEITLAPGEIIKRGKKVGVTIVNGRKVPIVQTSVYKPKGRTKKLIDLARKRKLSKKDLKKLDKILKKETGFNYGVSRPKKAVKRVSITKIGAPSLAIPRRPPKRLPKRPPKRPPRRPPKRPPKRPPRRPPKRPPRRPPKRPPKKPPKRPPKRPLRRPPKRPPKKPLRRPPKRPARIGIPARPLKPAKVVKVKILKKKKKKIKKVIGYNVWGKRLKGRKIKGKKRKAVWIKLNTKPLTKTHAQNRGAYAIDHSVARTFKIKRVRKVKRVGKITKKEGKYFKKTKKKYRPYKIRRKVKKPIVRKWIERKGKYLIDTRGEKRGLKLHRLAKQLKGKPLKKIKIKKKSTTTKFKKSKVLKKRVALGGKQGGGVTRGRISKPIKIKKANRFIKGSKEAKEFMAKLRGMRGR